jgi:SAM-dependent methyltransferase
MLTQTIRRQYDEVIAPHYDQDPQGVTGRSLDLAIEQLERQELLQDDLSRLRVLDVGVGTGFFLSKLLAARDGWVEPYGLDLSAKMVEAARERVPELVAAVDDAANLDAHFRTQAFDLICTHFITGFVPMGVLAPKIRDRLEEGGYWSLVGGTMAGFPALRLAAGGKAARMAFGGRTLEIDHMACNPADRAEVVRTLEANGFAVREAQTFEPKLVFRDLEQFMAFAYRGGWLTPFVEALGLHEANALTRSMLNLMFFPIEDRHVIEVVLAQKI